MSFVDCAHCGKSLKRFPSDVRRFPLHFCNKSHHMQYKNEVRYSEGKDVPPPWFKSFERRGFKYVGNDIAETPWGQRVSLESLEG